MELSSKLRKTKKSSTRQDIELKMGDLADTFITSFIDTQMALPDLGHFITTEFWDLVHQAEVDSGLASLKTGKMKKVVS